MQGNNSSPFGTSILGQATKKITPLSIVFQQFNKRDLFDVMDIEEDDTTNTPKKQKLDEVENLVQKDRGKGKKKQVKVKGPTFEVQEQDFTQTPKVSTNGYKSKSKLFIKYKETKDITMAESLKLFVEVRKYCGQEVSLVFVRDHKPQYIESSYSL